MFKIASKTIQITRGDTGMFTLSLYQNGQEYDYSDDEVLLTVKKSVYVPEIVMQKRISYGENIVIEPSDTANLAFGDYVYDVQVKTPGGIVDTVIPPSTFSILPEVTVDE